MKRLYTQLVFLRETGKEMMGLGFRLPCRTRINPHVLSHLQPPGTRLHIMHDDPAYLRDQESPVRLVF